MGKKGKKKGGQQQQGTPGEASTSQTLLPPQQPPPQQPPPQQPPPQQPPPQQPPPQQQPFTVPPAEPQQAGSPSTQTGRGRGRGRGRGDGRESYQGGRGAGPGIGRGAAFGGGFPLLGAQDQQLTAPPAELQQAGTSPVQSGHGRGRGRGRGDGRESSRGGRGAGRGTGRGSAFDARSLQESLPGDGDGYFSTVRGGRAPRSTPSQGGFPPLGGQQQQYQPQQAPPQQMQPQHAPPQQVQPQQAPRQPPQASRPATAPPVGPPTGPPAGARAKPPAEPAPTHLRGRKGVFQIPTRKDITKGGTQGKPIIVKTNHLPLDLSRLQKTAYHYDVALDPDKPKRLLRYAVEEFRKKNFPDRNPAFDGRKNLYSSRPLPFHIGEVTEISDAVQVFDPEMSRLKEYKITVKFARSVDLTVLNEYMKEGTSLAAPQQALQVLDIVLRSAAALRFVPVGRSYFTPPAGRVEPLGDGYEIWYGIFQSVVLGWKPFLNVDVVHKGFPSSQNAVQALAELCPNVNPRGGYLDDYSKKTFLKFIKGLKIDYELPGIPNSKRTYKVNDIKDIPERTTFPLENNTTTNVYDYFTHEKRIRLQYPNLPCLWVGSVNRASPIYLPLEFCTISSAQVTQKKLNEKQTSNMIRKAATNTDVRQNKIQDAMREAAFNRSSAVREFGLTVNESFTEVKARIIDAPDLEYNQEKIRPQRGVWQPTRFLLGTTLETWTVLVLDFRTTDDDIRKLIDFLKQQGRRLGMNVNEARPYTKLTVRDTRVLEGKVREFLKGCKDYNLVVVIVPEQPGVYAMVKQVAELNIGVLTQCIKGRTLQRMNFATAQNILLKVNSKLNGINHSLYGTSRPRIFSTPIMIVGADVTHPSPDQTHIPSVAAVCASHDPKGFMYNTQFRLQPPTVEIIADLQQIMREHLLFFYRRTKQQPQRIVFYRDGVSEGQFQEVLDQELREIRNACSSMQKDGSYKPPITFLVVQKRHHTRFFPRRREEGDGRNNNVLPGTIVDTTITHPTEKDFYLVSHASIQGVSRPTRYRCLWDDNDLSDDELEQLTYYLCHLFSRCTRSVSYPAPTYYAHLAAYRARVYIEGKMGGHDWTSLKIPQDIIIDFKKESPMYYV